MTRIPVAFESRTGTTLFLTGPDREEPQLIIASEKRELILTGAEGKAL